MASAEIEVRVIPSTLEGEVLRLDGQTQYIRADEAAAYRDAEGYTFEAWIKVDPEAQGEQPLFSWVAPAEGGGSPTAGFTLAVEGREIRVTRYTESRAAAVDLHVESHHAGTLASHCLGLR